MLSPLMTVPSNASAIRTARADWPLAVGPATITTGAASPTAPLAAAARLWLQGAMTHVLVLVAGAAGRLSTVQAAAVRDALATAGARPGAIDWLSPDEAFEIPLATGDVALREQDRKSTRLHSMH